MIDSGSVRNFIKKNAARKSNLVITKQKNNCPGRPNQRAKIIGEAIVVISLSYDTFWQNSWSNQGPIHRYRHWKRQPKKHNKVVMKFNGPADEFIIGAVINNNHFPSINVQPPPLFSHLSVDTIPIVTKSLRHSLSDNKSIRKETGRLLKKGIKEPSVSPWWAQLLVTSNENQKKRIVINYNDTVNRFTKLSRGGTSPMRRRVPSTTSDCGLVMPVTRPIANVDVHRPFG